MCFNLPNKVLLTMFVFLLVCFTIVTIAYANSENARIETKGSTYQLICNQGTITIYAPLGNINGISTEMVTAKWTEHENGKEIQQTCLKDKAQTDVKNIICEPLKKSSMETTQKASAVSTTAEAGTWMCTGENVEFTIKGFLARRQSDGKWDTSGANTLNWIIDDCNKCDFIID
ncbi:MAG: hypothetical protein K8S27_11580 [Candidatus Omnitrophica bacterium]|nr:hypothetical protein [Candidatus Omnitrophota bacterium]